MNKNLKPFILIIFAIGVYFTFTRIKIDEIKSISSVNAVYQQALDNSEKLVQKRDEVLANYNKIDISDRENLEKLLPDNIDNVRLIIDTNAVAARHGLVIKNVKTSAPSAGIDDKTPPANIESINTINQKNYNTMTLSFNIASKYSDFIDFIRDLEASLRIIDISKITLTVKDSDIYDFSVEIKTYWLKQ